MPAKKAALVSIDRVEKRIYQIRGQRVILSSDLAILYGVPVRALNQAVARNLERFPDDFMFQLTPHETTILRSQFVILKAGSRGAHSKYLPYAFTEQGVAMLSAVLRSPTPIGFQTELAPRSLAKRKSTLKSVI